jgi:predicted dehydrogenase
MIETVKLAVLGAGLIGKRHIEQIIAMPEAKLTAIVDPTPAARHLAAAKAAPWFESLASMLAGGEMPDGVIIATPNQLHVANSLEAIAAGIPVLVEKPIADDVAAATRLVHAAESAGVAVLVGHHRRHNPMIQKARQIIEGGRLGRVIAVHGFFWLMKPDDYFDVVWRREKGAGPVFLNLIHDVDLLRYLCGEVVLVQALESNLVRGHVVEETAVILLKFDSGALGTFNVSDSVVSPWSWEPTTGENPIYPRTNRSCYYIGGTHGSLTLPELAVWSNPGKHGWHEPLMAERLFAADEDPLRLQIQQFCRVIRGEEAPLVPGREGLKTLKVIEAVKTAARSGISVGIS